MKTEASKSDLIKTKINKRIKFILPSLVILILLFTVFYVNLEYVHKMEGDVVSVFRKYYAGSSQYQVTDVDAGRSFKAEGADPQFYLSNLNILQQKIGGIRIDFKSANISNEDLAIQVFYAKSGEGYSERYSKKAVLKPGEKSCMIPVPLGEYMSLRFDIDGDFSISNISICTQKMLSMPYISEKTIRNCITFFPLVIVGVILVFWAHIVRKREMKTGKRYYLKSVFLGSDNISGREVHFDYMRVLAAVLVILAHTCSPMVELADVPWKRLLLVCGLSLGLSCNLIYVMLSGSLLLSSKNTDSNNEEGVLTFYLKRASKIIIPLVVYYMMLLAINKEVTFLPPANILAAIKRIMTGAPDAAPHLWLIYTIVALYIVTPFFRIMVRNMDRHMLMSLTIVIFVLNTLTNYLPLFGMTFGATGFLAGWEGVFLLGYVMNRQNEWKGKDKRNIVCMITAVIAYVIAVAVVFENSANMNYVYNNSPVMLLISSGIFALFLQNKDWFTGKLNPVIRLLSKYSYSIVLIHWYVLFVIVQGKFYITALRFGCIGGIAVTVVLTFLICLIIAIVIDNTVVIVCNVLFDKLANKIVKKSHKKHHNKN